MCVVAHSAHRILALIHSLEFHRLFSESPLVKQVQAKPLDQQRLLKSQLSSLQSEKELAETQLKQTQAQVANLERENATLKREAERAKGIT